ncbi:MAG: EamA/RhaT family transporter, partial [Pseudomonadota bacterium]
MTGEAVAGKGVAQGIKWVLVAVTLFAAQDGISKHLAASYPVPFFVMIRYWFFAAFVIVIARQKSGGVRAAARTSQPVLQVARGLLLAAEI